MTKRILLGVSASISAYKSADIVRQLTKQGCEVEVIMTRHSTEFITPLTLQTLSRKPVHTDVMAEPIPDQINHIDIVKRHDLFVVAPASLILLAKSRTVSRMTCYLRLL